MKIFFRTIHLYLGLAAGLVITVTCLSGAILAFEEELQHTIHHERYYVQPSGQRMPVSQLVEQFSVAVPSAKVVNIRMYNASDRTVEIVYRPKKKGNLRNVRNVENVENVNNEGNTGKESKEVNHVKEGKKNHEGKEGREHPGNEHKKGNNGSKGKKEEGKPKQEENLRAYINPYTGDILALVDPKKSFFGTVEGLHRRLLAEDTGKLIVGISTSVFLFIIITGITLWWPANMNMLKQRLSIKRSAGWKRTNHDWHIVLGFYCSLFLFAFAFTGLAWSFKWFNDSIYTLTGSPLKNAEPPQSTAVEAEKTATMYDTAMYVAASGYRDAIFYQVNLPKDEAGSIAINVLPANAPHKNATDALYFDQYTGRQIGKLAFTERSKGARIRSFFLPVHTGAIIGMPGRILAFIATFLGSTFPTTGVIMWINRTRKKRKNKA